MILILSISYAAYDMTYKLQCEEGARDVTNFWVPDLYDLELPVFHFISES